MAKVSWSVGGVARAWRVAAFAVAVVVLWVPPAAAHGDRDVANGNYRIDADDTLALPSELHYHRLVARVDVHSGDGAVLVSLQGPDGHERPLAGPGASLRVNELVACCDQRVWSDHVVLVRNAGPQAVEVAVRVAFLHDGVAVAGTDSETGAAASMAVIPLVVFAFLLPRLRRPVTSDAGAPGPHLRRAAVAYTALWTLAGVFAVWGMARYGGGPVAGSVAATADLPVIEGDFLSVHLLLSVVLMALWVTSVALWTAAARRRPGPPHGTAAFGFVLAAGSVVLGATWAIEYGHRFVPALMAATTASYPLAGAIWSYRTASVSGSGRRNPPEPV